MVPCYQICKDHSCPYWDPGLLDCDYLPDECEFAIEHLVEDRENQYLDGEQHGLWSNYHANGQLRSEGTFVKGYREGLWRYLYDNGLCMMQANYENGLISDR